LLCTLTTWIIKQAKEDNRPNPRLFFAASTIVEIEEKENNEQRSEREMSRKSRQIENIEIWFVFRQQ